MLEYDCQEKRLFPPVMFWQTSLKTKPNEKSFLAFLFPRSSSFLYMVFPLSIIAILPAVLPKADQTSTKTNIARGRSPLAF